MNHARMASRRRPASSARWPRAVRQQITRPLAVLFDGLFVLTTRYRWPLILILSIALLIAASIGLRGPAEPEVPGRLAVPPAPLERTLAEAPVQAPIVETAPVPTAETDSEPSWQYVQVARGETLERIFRRLGLSPRLLHQVVHLNEQTRQLARLKPGDEFAFEIDPERGFRSLRAELDDQTWLFVEATADGLVSRTESRQLQVRQVETHGVIRSNLFNAGRDAGLSDNMILRLANIFGWDIDFALDVRSGDRFALVYEEILRDGDYLRDGAILVARFINQGQRYEAIRFDAGEGPDYYAPDGRPMRKAFLRAPLNFTRVTSNFNPRRFHPITRRVRPHNGTDYGAPTGTPVWAAGDGVVIESGYGNANGNYVFIQHGNQIVTRYLHLHRRHVKRGDRVRQGQTIGTVGATGLATGPHLHYEFLVHGAHRNPRTVDLPPALPLPETKLAEFNHQAAPLLARLDQLTPDGVILASAQPACRGEDSDC